jgi:hypothetical protein
MLQSMFEKLRNISLHLTFPTQCAHDGTSPGALFFAKNAEARSHSASGLRRPASFSYISGARFRSVSAV